MNPKYPVILPTKGRYKTPFTITAFETLKIPYIAVVESQELEFYKPVIKTGSILVLPHQNKGLTVTRNWIWDYVQNELRTEYFWTFDDNIRWFYRLHKGVKYRIDSGGGFLRAIEEFTERYENLYISGMNYKFFVPSRANKKPVIHFNTRIYSNMLIKTDIPYRNVTFYNDDTDLCLRVLKGGHCTALFNAFLADKLTTMTVKGGNTPIYQGDGRLKMAQELQRAHPDVTKITRKWGRWQHQVDYRPFKGNKLIRKEGVIIPDEPNEYGMKLIRLDEIARDPIRLSES